MIKTYCAQCAVIHNSSTGVRMTISTSPIRLSAESSERARSPRATSPRGASSPLGSTSPRGTSAAATLKADYGRSNSGPAAVNTSAPRLRSTSPERSVVHVSSTSTKPVLDIPPRVSREILLHHGRPHIIIHPGEVTMRGDGLSNTGRYIRTQTTDDGRRLPYVGGSSGLVGVQYATAKHSTSASAETRAIILLQK